MAALAHLYPNTNEGGFADLRGRLIDQKLSGYAVERIIRLLMADGVLHRRVEDGVEQFALNSAQPEPLAATAPSPAVSGPASTAPGPPPGIVFNSGTLYYQHNGGTIQSGTANTSTHSQASGGESDMRRLAEQIASALRQDAAGSTDPAMAQAARHAAADVEQAAKTGDKNRWDGALDRIQKLSTAAGPVLTATTQVLTLILGNKA
ncbi:hypothetical protein ABH935_005850 [Catenulispora sp. GAS73]|uniref:hypothetical protein n=1 Tax=Catenulispora sp. GAS73 TaxID=3156269 RepID=UPI00351252E9